MNMNLRQLESIVALGDHGSFSSAADAVGTVQSNVSTHIANLERELNVTLYDRTNGLLTDEGVAFVERARVILAELASLEEEVKSRAHDVIGTVRVGMIGTTARWMTPKLLAAVPERYPRLGLVIVEGTSTSLEPQLLMGHLDLALLNLPVSDREMDAEPLFAEDLLLVVPANSVLARRPSLRLAELASLNLLLPMPGTAFRDEIDRACKPLGIRLRSQAEVDGTTLIASLTFEGFGPAILPATAVPDFLRSDWRLVPVDGLPPRRIGLARRRRGLMAAPVRALRSMIKELVASDTHLPVGLHPVGSGREPVSEARAT